MSTKTHWRRHPIHKFIVYNDDDESFCLTHPNKGPFNEGSLRQHVRGKDHRIDYDTGGPLKTKNNSELSNDLAEQKNQYEKHIQKEDVEILIMQLNYLFPEKEVFRKAIALEHWFKGERFNRVQAFLISEELEKTILKNEDKNTA